MTEKGLKRAAVVEDLSGFGRCALTVALPVLAAAGVEAVPVPTAVLSSHLGLPGAVMEDLTHTMRPAAAQYAKLGIRFDAMYTGFLGNVAQADLVREMRDMLCNETTLFLVDPVMGDHGRLYRSVTDEMVQAMRGLCDTAWVITPNVTEAAALLDIPYRSIQTMDDARQIARRLCDRGSRMTFLTGIPDGDNTGVLIAVRGEDRVEYVSAPRIEGAFHGTGDLFASVLLGALLRGEEAVAAAQQAVDFVSRCVKRTANSGCNPAFGLLFEPELKILCQSAEVSEKSSEKPCK